MLQLGRGRKPRIGEVVGRPYRPLAGMLQLGRGRKPRIGTVVPVDHCWLGGLQLGRGRKPRIGLGFLLDVRGNGLLQLGRGRKPRIGRLWLQTPPEGPFASIGPRSETADREPGGGSIG